MADQTEVIRDRVRAAFESDTPLCIEGGGTKRFLGRAPAGEPLKVGEAPRGRQPCAERASCSPCGRGRRWPIRRRPLAEHGQWLAFDPPRHEEASTIGGVVACALSGPARPWTGAVRDFVLGTRIVNGRGDVLSFGGEVMKNVAGYDVSRLMAGALGTLGVLLEVSFKLLPRPAWDRTRVLELTAGEAIRRLTEWARAPLPILGACHDGERLHVRLAGAQGLRRRGRGADRRRARGRVPVGEPPRPPPPVLRERRGWAAGLAALRSRPRAPPSTFRAPVLIDWGGAQRWVRSDAPGPELRAAAEAAGGHATLLSGRRPRRALPPARRRARRSPCAPQVRVRPPPDPEPRPAVPRPLTLAEPSSRPPERTSAMQTSIPASILDTPNGREAPKGSCESACTAGSATRPAPPISSSATSWTARGGGSIS